MQNAAFKILTASENLCGKKKYDKSDQNLGK